MTTDLIRQALDAAGYHHEPATEKAQEAAIKRTEGRIVKYKVRNMTA